MKKAALLLCFFMVFLTGCASSSTENVEEYRMFQSKIGFEIHSDLTLLPKQRMESATKEEYYYSFDDTFLDKSVQIYYDCTYATEEDYLQEKERLASAQNTYADGGTASYDNENFNYPAYVIKVGSDNTSEYALLMEEEHRIIYIFIQYVAQPLIHFDKRFLPKGYTGSGECDANYQV